MPEYTGFANNLYLTLEWALPCAWLQIIILTYQVLHQIFLLSICSGNICWWHNLYTIYIIVYLLIASASHTFCRIWSQHTTLIYLYKMCLMSGLTLDIAENRWKYSLCILQIIFSMSFSTFFHVQSFAFVLTLFLLASLYLPLYKQTREGKKSIIV